MYEVGSLFQQHFVTTELGAPMHNPLLSVHCVWWCQRLHAPLLRPAPLLPTLLQWLGQRCPIGMAWHLRNTPDRQTSTVWATLHAQSVWHTPACRMTNGSTQEAWSVHATTTIYIQIQHRHGKSALHHQHTVSLHYVEIRTAAGTGSLEQITPTNSIGYHRRSHFHDTLFLQTPLDPRLANFSQILFLRFTSKWKLPVGVLGACRTLDQEKQDGCLCNSCVRGYHFYQSAEERKNLVWSTEERKNLVWSGRWVKHMTVALFSLDHVLTNLCSLLSCKPTVRSPSLRWRPVSRPTRHLSLLAKLRMVGHWQKAGWWGQ